MVRLTDAAFDDLILLARKGDPQAVRWALKKCLLLERNPEAGEELRGALIGYRKLTVGNRDWRVVWRVTHAEAGTAFVDVAEVWAVGARSDSEVYAEMEARVARLAATPRTMALADAVERLGKLARGIEPSPQTQPETDPEREIPAWLVHVLTKVVGMPREEVDRLTAEQAKAVWDGYAGH